MDNSETSGLERPPRKAWYEYDDDELDVYDQFHIANANRQRSKDKSRVKRAQEKSHSREFDEE